MIIPIFKNLNRTCRTFIFWKEKRGATAIEYALIAAGIALAIVAIVFVIGDDVLGLFQGVETELEAAL